MDNHVDHTQTTCQSTCGSVCNYYPTKSCDNTDRSKSSDKQSTCNSHSTYTEDTKCPETATSFQIESKPEIIRTLSTEKLHNKKIKEMRKRQTLPAKTVFLKWWLDTSGCSKPLRSAWEEEEECMFRSAASSHPYSPTYFDGPGISYHQSANNEAYMFVSTRDPLLRNSVSGVSRLINLLPRTHKKHKTKTKSLRSHMNSPLSLNESVNQKVSLSQHFLDNDNTVCEKKCAESGQNQESEHKVNDMHHWLLAVACATRDVHDRNTSSNVVLPVHVSSDRTSGASNQNHVDNVNKNQKENPKNNAPLSHVQEVSNQQTSTPDMNKVNEFKYKQNSENNSNLQGNTSNDSQSDNQQFSDNVSRKDIMGPKSGPVNEPECEELTVSDDPVRIQTFVIADNHPFTHDTEVFNGTPQEIQHEEPQYNQLLDKETEGAIVTTNSDQDYISPIIKTGPDGHNSGHVNSSLAKEAGKSPPKSRDSMGEMKAGCLPGHDICKPKSLSPNFYVRFGNLTHTELGKRRQLLSSQTHMMNNDSVSVHDDNICMRSRGSYFSRLAEKRIGARGSQMNRHEDALKAGKFLPNKHAHTEDQSSSTSTNFICSNQSNEQSQLPLAILRETLWNSGLHNHLVIHKHPLSDDPRNKKIQTPSDGSNPLKQYLPQNSEIPPFDNDNNFSNDNAGHINGAMIEKDLEKCSSLGVLSEYPQTNDCRLNSTDKIRNHNYAKFESEDENSSLDDNEQNSMSSNAYSSEKSASVASRNSSSDLDESVSNYVKWSAASWSNTSLPPQHYFESEASQIKYAASTTKIDEMRQKQIIQTAKLLILLLDKLPMKGCAWNDCLCENKRKIKYSTSKCAHGGSVARSVSFKSHILSLLSKHYSFNKIKPFKTGNEESVPRQTLERNRTTRNSKLTKCMHANLIPKDKLVYANRKLYTNKTHTRLSFIDNLQKPKFHGASYGLTKYGSKMNEQGCIKHSRKQKKNMCQFHQMFPKRKSTRGSQKVFYDISPLGSFKNMQFQSPDSENQPASQKSQSSNQISYPRQEKQERNKNKTDVNNSENITNESYTKYGSFRVSKRINRERSRRLSDVNFLNAKPDHQKENMAAGTVFISKTSLLRGHKPHPPNASLEESQVKITLLSPPGLNPREPVYPKPKPYALGKKRVHKATTSKQICDLPDSSATQLSLGSFKRSFTSKIPWTKPHLKNKLQASEIHDISTSVSVSSATMETTETRLFMKNNKVYNPKTQKNVLPPLYHITSENIDTSLDKLSTNNSKIPKSALLVDQRKTAAPGQDKCQIKQDLSSLVPLDTMFKPQYDSVSPENSRRIHRQTTLTSLHNHGQLLSPLRRRFDCIKNKASSCVLKALHSPNLRISCAPHYLCAHQARDNNDVEKITTASPEVWVPNIDANDLQSLMAQNGLDEGNSCNSLEMHDLTLFVNKKNITSEKTETSAITCENITAVERVQNMHKNNCACTNKSPDTRICDKSKVINNQDHDKKTSDIAQENNNSDTTSKKPNTLVPKSKCPSTSTFKFLTLILSDELESSHI